jgi:hypothetical protein
MPDVASAPPVANLAAYIRHAEQYGGLRDCWDAAAEDLAPVELGELAVALRGIGARRRRVGRSGRTVTVEAFRLSRDEVAALAARLIEAGVGEVDVCRYTGASPALVAGIGRAGGSDPHKPPDLDPARMGLSVTPPGI